MTKQDALDHFGGATKLAAALGVSRPAIYQWGETIPPLRQLQLQRITRGKLKADDAAMPAKRAG